MSIKVGDKFIIEIGTIAELPDGKKKYFINPFESLVFDRKGLEQLEPVEKAWKSELEKAKLVAYKDGFEHGKFWDIKENAENRQGYYNDGYNNAIEDLAHAMKVYFPLNAKERLDYFGINTHVDTYAIENPKDLIAKAKAYEEKKNAEEDIKVGDVVKFNEKCHNYDHVKSREFLVLHIFDNGLVTLLYDNGDTGAAEISLLDKTDRHIDGVSQLLDKLRGKTDEKN